MSVVSHDRSFGGVARDAATTASSSRNVVATNATTQDLQSALQALPATDTPIPALLISDNMEYHGTATFPGQIVAYIAYPDLVNSPNSLILVDSGPSIIVFREPYPIDTIVISDTSGNGFKIAFVPYVETYNKTNATWETVPSTTMANSDVTNGGLLSVNVWTPLLTGIELSTRLPAYTPFRIRLEADASAIPPGGYGTAIYKRYRLSVFANAPV